MIYKLLNIPPNSMKIYLLLLPPIYSLWLLALGKKLLSKQNKSSLIFSIIAFISFILFTINCFAPIYLLIQNISLTPSQNGMKGVFLLTAIFWLITISILTYLTVKQDRRSIPKHHHNIINNIDYVKRLLIFIYWPFFIWSFQKTVNNYN